MDFLTCTQLDSPLFVLFFVILLCFLLLGNNHKPIPATDFIYLAWFYYSPLPDLISLHLLVSSSLLFVVCFEHIPLIIHWLNMLGFLCKFEWNAFLFFCFDLRRCGGVPQRDNAGPWWDVGGTS